MKSTKTKAAKKAATKGRARKTDHVAMDAEIEIERIAAEHGDVGNAAQNFYYTVNFTPAFLRTTIYETLARAAVKLNLPPFTDEGDEIEQFTRLVNLFEATSEGFTLETGDQLADALSTILNNPDTPERIYNAIADELCDMSSEINYHTPEMVARTLDAHKRKEVKRTKR